MTVDSRWYDNNQTIFHIVYKSGWTWKDMHWHDSRTVIPSIQGSPYPVALIVDLSEAPLLPPREFSENIKQSIESYHSLNIDVVVFTLQESSIAHLLQTSHRYYGTPGRQYLTAKNVDEAIQQINQHRVYDCLMV